MKVADRLTRLAKEYGCEVEDDGYAWSLWLEGVMWVESQSPVLVQQYKNWGGQTWMTEAIADLEDRAAEGAY
jgi:hypothetical protein